MGRGLNGSLGDSKQISNGLCVVVQLKMENLLVQKQRKFFPSFYAFSCLYKLVKAGSPTTPGQILGLNLFRVCYGAVHYSR